MSTDENNDDELTVESLTKKKEDFLTHGLDDTALGDALDERITDEEREAAKRQKLVEKKILLTQAEKNGLDGDSDVEALRADIHDMSDDLEAEALVAEQQEEESEARKKISELEALAGSSNGAMAKSYEEKAEALRAKHGWTEEPGKYSAEALVENKDDLEDADAEALSAHRERKEIKEIDEQMSDEDRTLLNNLKGCRSSARTPKAREIYEKKIEDLRDKYRGE